VRTGRSEKTGTYGNTKMKKYSADETGHRIHIKIMKYNSKEIKTCASKNVNQR
jgi:hypothetical protein